MGRGGKPSHVRCSWAVGWYSNAQPFVIAVMHCFGLQRITLCFFLTCASAQAGVRAPDEAADRAKQPEKKSQASGTWLSGELCTGPLGELPTQCGPVQIAIGSAGQNGRAKRWQIRVSDITYALTLRGATVDVVVTHGAMQIDEFSAPVEQSARTLNFSDAEKGLRYRVSLSSP